MSGSQLAMVLLTDVLLIAIALQAARLVTRIRTRFARFQSVIRSLVPTPRPRRAVSGPGIGRLGVDVLS